MDKPLPEITGETKPAALIRQISNPPLIYSFESILKRCLTESGFNPGLLGFVGVMSYSYLKNTSSPTVDNFKSYIDDQLGIARRNYQARIESGNIEDKVSSTMAAFDIAESFLSSINTVEEVTFDPTYVYLSDVIKKGDRTDLEAFFEALDIVSKELDSPVTESGYNDSKIELPNNDAVLNSEKLALVLTKLGLTYEERLFLITTFIEYSRRFRSTTIELGIFELCVKERVKTIHRIVKNNTKKFLARSGVDESVLEDAIMKRVVASYFPIQDGSEQFIHNLLIDLLASEKETCFSEVMMQIGAYFSAQDSDEITDNESNLPLTFKDATELLSDASKDTEL